MTNLKPYDQVKLRYKLKKVGWDDEVINKYIKTLNRDNKQYILDVIKKDKD